MSNDYDLVVRVLVEIPFLSHTFSVALTFEVDDHRVSILDADGVQIAFLSDTVGDDVREWLASLDKDSSRVYIIKHKEKPPETSDDITVHSDTEPKLTGWFADYIKGFKRQEDIKWPQWFRGERNEG